VESSLRKAFIWDETKDNSRKSGNFSPAASSTALHRRGLRSNREVILMDDRVRLFDPISTLKIEELMTNSRKPSRS